ncbi:MAG: M10 family metallopeptidase C-terminal domain-containing protein, partial [Burkholderiales bacterium]
MPSQSDLYSLLSGYRWGSSGGVNLTYSFPTSAYGTNSEPQTFSALNATQQTAAVSALQAWSNVANIILTPSANGDIRFGFTIMASSGGSTTLAYAYYPTGGAAAGDVWLNGNLKGSFFASFASGAKSFATLLHELGHAFGLKHPFDDSPTLPASLQTSKYTVMAYGDLPGAFDANTGSFTGQQANFLPTTPMLLDIAAIQNIYGANTSYHAGNDVYVFNQGQTYYQTIWDAGGNDTIQWNGTSGVKIDLQAGNFSQLGNPITFTGGAAPQLDTVAIAYGVTIENAIGGSGNDTLIGNYADNVLTGGAGDDTLDGGAGNDTLIGGSGNDIYFFGFGYGQDTVQEFDSLPGNIDAVMFGAGILPSTVRVQIQGNDLIFVLVGRSDRLIVSNFEVGSSYQIERAQFADSTFWTAAIFTNQVNHLPIINAPDRTVTQNQWYLAATFFSVTDADSDSITQYQFIDNTTTAGSGYIWTNGSIPAAGTTLTVNSADLANTWIRGGANVGTDNWQVRAYDGVDWSNWASFNLRTKRAPVISAADASARPNQ